MIRRPPRSTQSRSSAASDVYKRQHKAFLRSPIEFSRVSSRFSLSRFHPILNKWRSHKGTDFAAPMGTKVKVTADGVVSVVGKQGGYGNAVSYTHLRAH